MIPTACADRVMRLGDGESLRRGLLDLFNAASNDAEIQNLPSATLAIQLYDQECNLQPGDWAPELHIVVRKVSEHETTDPSSEEHDNQSTAEEGSA